MPPADDAPTATHNGRPAAASTLPPSPPAPPGSTAPGGDGGADDFERWALGDAPDRYRLVAKHKSGGLGEVWHADDPVVRRRVAVKVLRPDRQSADLAARFVREAQVTGQLDHPNIVPLYDLFRTPDGPAYAMRFLAGDTLAAAAKGFHDRRAKGEAGPLELPKLLGAFVLVCEAVAFAHSKGVLHRDLKGQNILLGPFGEVCLADWGLAKRIGEPDRPGDPSPLSPPLPEPDAATEPGAVMGTPAFMAPEVAAGRPATPASDVYGLGAVLYQVLTDTAPHAGTTPKEIISKINEGEPVPPPRAVNPDLPPALAAVCEKALRRTAADRYESATALADEVRAYLAGEPVGAYPEPWSVKAGRWVKRHRAGVLAAVVGLAVLAVASTAAAVLVYQEKERTAAKQREAEANLAIALGLSDQFQQFVETTETGQAPNSSEVAVRKQSVGRAVAAARRLAADGVGDTDRLARLLWFAGNLARLTGDHTEADDGYAAAERVMRRAAAERPTADARRDLAGVLRDRAAGQAATGQLSVAVTTLAAADRELAGDESPAGRRAVAAIALQRAAVLIRLGRSDEAETTAREAAEAFARAAVLPEAHFLDETQHGLGLLRAAQAVRAGGGDPAAGLSEAVAVLGRAADARPHRDARANYLRGLVELARSRRPLGDGLPDLDRAVAGFATLAEADPKVAGYRQLLAQALTARADVWLATDEPALRGRAAIDLDRAVGLLEPMARIDSPDRPDYRADLAEAWVRSARLYSDRQAAHLAYRNAASVARGAVRLAPEDVHYPRRRDEVVGEAELANFDVRQPAGP